MKQLCIFIPLLLWLAVSQAQTVNISGKIIDTDNGETIIGVIIQDSLHQSYTTTDETGRFILKVPFGSIHLKVSHVGFLTTQMHFFVRNDTSLLIPLTSVKLNEVEIIASATSREQLMPGLTKIPVAQLTAVPSIAGETDIFKALSLTPGVSEGIEGTTGLYVRGGTPDQNLILLDDATVYNPAHLYGFVSVFNPKTIKDVKLLKGGFPARYGGRASSVIDITTKEGNSDHFAGSGGIGLINSDLLLEGPVKRGKSTFLLAGRANYLGLFLLPLTLQYKTGNTDELATLSIYDLNAKYSHQFNENNKFILSAYAGKDIFGAFQRDGDLENVGKLAWGNITTTARYQTILAQKASAKFMLLYTGYRYSLSGTVRDSTRQNLYGAQQASNINVLQFQTDVSYPITHNYVVRVGGMAARNWFEPTRLLAKDYTLDTAYLKTTQIPTLNAAAYIDNELDLSKRVFANIGLRYSTYWNHDDSSTFTSFEPRLSLGYKMKNDWSMSVAYSTNRQFLHLLSLEGGSGLPNEIWVPATKKARPSTSNQIDYYLRKYIPKAKTELSLGGYLKSMADLIEYQQGIGLENRFKQNWEDIIVTQGKGLSYGAELFAHKQAGRLNGWISYTLAWSLRRFPDLNQNKLYPAPYDKRHSLEIFAQYTLSDVWKIGGTWVFQSGAPFTAPVAIAYTTSNPNTDPTDFHGADVSGHIYNGLNNARLPAYHRLDLSVTCTFDNGLDRIGELSFGAYNVYAKVNPLYFKYKSTVEDNQYRRYVEGTAPFVFIPAIKYSLTFK
jgi:hypothetical protein